MDSGLKGNCCEEKGRGREWERGLEGKWRMGEWSVREVENGE